MGSAMRLHVAAQRTQRRQKAASGFFHLKSIAIFPVMLFKGEGTTG